MAVDETHDLYCELISHLGRDRDRDKDPAPSSSPPADFKDGTRGVLEEGMGWSDSSTLLESISCALFIDHQLTGSESDDKEERVKGRLVEALSWVCSDINCILFIFLMKS